LANGLEPANSDRKEPRPLEISELSSVLVAGFDGELAVELGKVQVG
jgi:hypothetical protein